MLEVLRSSVNTWDCDQMGHMNVRRYFAHANSGLSVLLLQLGLTPRQLRGSGLALRARDQHLRFRQELRPGAGFSVHAGAVHEHPSSLTTYAELRTLDSTISATTVTQSALLSRSSGEAVPWPAAVLEAAQRAKCEVPEYAAPRGVVARAERTRMTRQQALALGMAPGYLGPVLAEDCDELGLMHESACIARIADGISHFFYSVQGGPRPNGIGGAALEYRIVFHAWPRVSDAVEVRTALSALEPKTMQIMHYLFDLETEQCVASSQAVVVWFDLSARKVVAMPDDVRAKLQARLIAGLTL